MKREGNSIELLLTLSREEERKRRLFLYLALLESNSERTLEKRRSASLLQTELRREKYFSSDPVVFEYGREKYFSLLQIEL